MRPDSRSTGAERVPGAVVAAVDDGSFLIADVSRDDAWVAVSRDDAPVLAAYR